MPQGIKPADGVYRCQDRVNTNADFAVVFSDGEAGCIFGSFSEVPAPDGGVMFQLDPDLPIYLIFHADGTFALVKPGPDAAGPYTAV